MIPTLFNYQDEAVNLLVDAFAEAQRAYKGPRRKKTAIGLSSPTGTGKTVMATALLERLFAEDPSLVVVWMSDSPELNRQSLSKILAQSDQITATQLRHLGELDQEVLDPGTITFTHVQALSKGATTMHATNVRDGQVQSNDSRQFGVWDMLAASVQRYQEGLLLLIDEAHSSIGVTDNARKTILATVIHGGSGSAGVTMPPTPIVLGMSATDERFRASVGSASSDHNLDPVSVDMDKVRDAGILKDRILVPRPSEKQAADHTLLALAVDTLNAMRDGWGRYAAEKGAPVVSPCLVVQVPAGTKDASLGLILDTLAGADNRLTGPAVAHCFDTHSPAKAPGGRVVRYIEPSKVASPSSGVDVVLFKEALTTGWDCPRAEVLVSMKAAASPTNIAQLIGRMVRSPLAARVEGAEGELLNSVTLILPHYESGAVTSVVRALTGPTGGNGPTVSLAPETMPHNPMLDPHDLEEALALLRALPSASRPAKTYRTDTDRARALALALSRSLGALPGLPDFNADLDGELVDVMKAMARRRAQDIEAGVDDILHLDMTTERIDTSSFDVTSGGSSRVALSERDLDRAYTAAVKSLPGSAGPLFYNTLDGVDDRADRATVAALARQPEVTAALEKTSRELIANWRKEWSSEVDRFGARGEVDALWGASTHIVETTPKVRDDLPNVATETAGKNDGDPTSPLPAHGKHLYARPDGTFPVKYGSTWEEEVLTKETSHPTAVAWYRNPPSGESSLAIPYEAGETPGLLHPDFLFFRRAQDGALQVDVIDPHMHASADTGPKWRGLAAWAAQHADEPWLGRVWAVIKKADTLSALDLRDPGVAHALAGVHDKVGVESVFDRLGVDY